MKLTFVNVGYGEAILLEIPEASRRDGIFTALIDGGSADRQEYEDRSSGRIPVWDYLQKEHIGHLDLMVCTHIHEDLKIWLNLLKHSISSFLKIVKNTSVSM